jgi:molecular chaperone Hsp33
MLDTDFVQRFIFEKANIRGEMTRVQETYQTILGQRPYPPMVRQLLGEAIIACLLLVNTMKFKGTLSLQFQGDKRLPLLLVQCDHERHIRALANYDTTLEAPEYADAFLKGTMVFTIQADDKTQGYQSLIPIESTSISEILMQYFAKSEQISTYIWIATNDTMAAGLLLQQMPGEDNPALREEFWQYAVHIGQTLKAEELFTLDTTTILHRLYHEVDIRLFDSQGVSFECRCSKLKMERILHVLGEKDCQDLLKEHKIIEARCEFCNTLYVFDEIDVTMAFRT